MSNKTKIADIYSINPNYFLLWQSAVSIVIVLMKFSKYSKEANLIKSEKEIIFINKHHRLFWYVRAFFLEAGENYLLKILCNFQWQWTKITEQQSWGSLLQGAHHKYAATLCFMSLLWGIGPQENPPVMLLPSTTGSFLYGGTLGVLWPTLY